MSSAPTTRRTGTVMLILAWLVGLGLAAHWFSGVEERRRNPNQVPVTYEDNGAVEVRLQPNRQGHYLVNGRINGGEVTFMLDTGATFVAIPAGLADELGLPRGRAVTVQTANGPAQSFTTRIDTLVLGDIRLHDVGAGIVPGMTGNDVLLGMSALQQLDFSQRGGQLILRQNRQ